MSVIADLLHQIKTAVYGRDVRQAIHDAIQQCYLDSAEGITPVITTETVSGGHNIKITVGADTTTVYVANGQNGQNGTNGTNGKDGKDGQNGQNGTNGVGSLPDGTYTAQEIHTSGTLTSNGTYVIFFIPFVDAVNRTITITPTKISVRDRGNYLVNSLTTGVTYEYVLDATGILVKAIKSDGWGGENNSVVSVQFVFDLTVEGSAQDISESLAQIQTNKEDIDTLKADLEDLDDRVEALESGSGGSGLTESIKTALMNLVNHLAWDDDDPTGQTYITALYDALYPPAPPASLTSITAVYTQSGTVFETDTLNDLKSDLVVTANYSDSTSHAVTDYTLSGTLAEGTSVIAVTYNGKSTTFSVTVTSGHLYPIENGSHTFTTNNRVLTVTRGSHFVYEAPNSTSDGNPKGAYLNLSTVSDNDTSATTASNITLNDVLFTIPANAQVVFEVKNISFTNLGTSGSNNKYAFNMRNGATSLRMSSGDSGISDTADISFTKTFDADTPVTCIYLYASNQFSRFEADISLMVNNVRWI